MLNILYQMNRDQVKALSERTNLAFLPVSPCEAHGPHLPVSADVITAFTMAKDCARKLEDQGIESLIATPITYCIADLCKFPGTITIRYETMVNIVEDVCLGLAKTGFTKVVLLSGHAEPSSMDAIKEGANNVKKVIPEFEFMFSDWFAKALPLTYKDICKGEHPEFDIHAGEIETAQLMYVCPEWVDTDVAKTLPANHAAEFFFAKLEAGAQSFAEAGAPNTYFGSPAVATAEVGRKIFDVVSDFILNEMKENLK